MGLPYVLSSDLVSAYPAKSLSIAEYVDGQIPLLAMTQNAQTGVSYSFVLTDFTKLVTTSNAGAVAVTLPLESSVAWPAGTQLRILNIGAGTVTVAGAVGVTISGTPLTLAQFKGANLIKTGTNTWVMLPFASGVGAADFSDTATGTYSGYKYLTFSASGTITVTTAGFADILLVASGGGGGCVGGGAGGGAAVEILGAYLPVGTLTVTIPGGGAGGTNSPYNREPGSLGGVARIASYFCSGGGGGGGNRLSAGFQGGSDGASGGGAALGGAVAAGGTGFQGSNGGAAGSGGSTSGGGGGAIAVGAAGSAAGGNGGAGLTSALDNTSRVYGSGGGGGTLGGTAGTGGTNAGNGTSNDTTPTAATANRGGGGGGSGLTSSPAAGGNGGSGIVIVRVAV